MSEFEWLSVRPYREFQHTKQPKKFNVWTFWMCLCCIGFERINTFKLSILWNSTAPCEHHDYVCVSVCACEHVCACAPGNMYECHACVRRTKRILCKHTVKQRLCSSFALTRLYHKRHIMVNDLVRWLLCFCTFIVFFRFLLSFLCLLLSIAMKTFSMGEWANRQMQTVCFWFLVFIFVAVEVNAIFVPWK